MLNPKEVTDYNRNDWDIQLFFFFCCAVAGKKSEPTAEKVQALSDEISEADLAIWRTYAYKGVKVKLTIKEVA